MDINALFEAWDQKKVLIVGDVMIDQYITGKVNRISPEAPVPVVYFEHKEERIGGAANVALNIKALGAIPILCSVIGQDFSGNSFLKLLNRLKLNPEGIIASSDRKTTVKTRVIAQNQQLIRIDEEDHHDLVESEENQFLQRVFEIIQTKSIDVILFQDYNKGVLTPKVIRSILLEAIKRDIPSAVDPKFKNFWAYNHCTLFKPNLKEIQSQVEFPVDSTLDTLNKASKVIRTNLDNAFTLITLSEKGLFWDTNGKHQLVGTTPRSITDVSGAGDTVISIAALFLTTPGYLEYLPLMSNLGGGQVCEKVGVVPVNRAQLKKEFEQFSQTKGLQF